MPEYSVVIPVYHGEKTLRALNDALFSFFEDKGYSFEIIYVFDCGPDRSWSVLEALKAEHPEQLTIVHLSRNYGQHNALICGFEYARSPFIITMDEDLQHRPEDIQNLIDEQAKDDYDLVYGKYHSLKHNLFRNSTSRLLKKLIRLGIPALNPDFTAFRLVKTTVAKLTIDMHNSYTFLDGYLSWVTLSTSSCIVQHQERMAGTSSYTLSKLVHHSMNIFFTFSKLPVRFLSYTSIFIFIATFIYSCVLLIRKLVYNDLVPGFASLMIAIGMGIALILLGLSIIGEYLYQINLKSTRKPNYVIKKIERCH